LRVLLGVTYIQLELHLMCGGSVMDYNELKIPVLQVLLENGPSNSTSVVRKLSESKGITLEIHALRMALMRYYKQGLLKRERAGGMLTYTISDRGVNRLRWLEAKAEASRKKDA